MIYFYLFFYALILIFKASSFGIGVDEAKIIFNSEFFITIHSIFPSELGVRVFNILITLVNIYLVYILSKEYFKNEKDAFFTAIIYSLFPATIAGGVVVNKAPFIIFLVLVFIFLYKKSEKLSLFYAFLLIFIDNSFVLLFLALSLYYLFQKNYLYAVIFILYFTLSFLVYGFDIGGKPKNYFFDTFGVYAAIFSPLIFLYFFYTIYRILVKGRKDIIWFISGVAFLFSIFLSFRQKIDFLDFAPYVVIGVPLMIRTFLSSYRVRIKKHRKKLKIAFVVVIFSLIVTDLILIFNSYLFLLYPNKKHFAYKNYLIQSLSKYECVNVEDKKIQNALKFYGVSRCSDRCEERKIYYENIYLGDFCVSKGNN